MAETCRSPLPDCSRCPRLVALRWEIREKYPDYHAAPVPAWGSRDARLLIVGLAPGMHGANRTGRPFTGDASGTFLFQALHRAGLATAPDANRARLKGVRITNAVKCLPPENRPTAAEVRQCRPYLAEELTVLTGRSPRQPRAVLCLGRLAHDAVASVIKEQRVHLEGGDPAAPEEIAIPDFQHGRCTEIASRLLLADTYHPSRQNTNTRRLTATMLDQVLEEVVRILAA